MSDGPDRARLAVEQLVDLYARQHALRKEFTDRQLAALDALWRAKRAGQVTDDAADRIEELIREGRVHGARKRLSNIRRSGGTAPD